MMTTDMPLSTEKSAFLAINGVSKVYPTPTGSYPVLDNINLTVAEGEFVCVIGHSGCGKSTLVQHGIGFQSANRRGSSSYRIKSLKNLGQTG